jgi:TIR domain
MAAEHIMPKARLFFSHSTKKGSAERKALMCLADALEADYEVLLDRTTLKLGGNWRPIIRDWIKGCDAAVVLITPGSIASEFCKYEWSILSFRRTLQEKFLIIPIYLGSTPDAIKGRPDQISEISGSFDFDDTESMISQVKERLHSEPPRARRRFQITLITDSLQTVSEQTIDIMAANADLDLGDWDFEGDMRLRFTTKIMSVGLARAFSALQDVRRALGDANVDKFRAIVELIGRCSWVDTGAAQRIRACALGHAAAQGLFGLNADGGETAKCYVLTGSDKHPDDSWKTGAVLDDLTSEDHLYKRVRSELIGLLNLNDDDSDATLRQELDDELRGKRPIFIVLKSKALTADWIERLRETELFAGITFLVLTGETITPGLLPDGAVLTPVLPAGLEKKVWSDYAKTKRNLQLT